MKLTDNGDNFSITYETNFEIDGRPFTEQLDLAVKFGLTKEDYLAVCIIREKGDRLYFKKISKEIKKLYIYCLI